MRHRMRQGTGLSKDMGHFKGTDNARVEDMLNEADDFATKLKKYEKHLRDASAATTGSLLCPLATSCLWLCTPAICCPAARGADTTAQWVFWVFFVLSATGSYQATPST